MHYLKIRGADMLHLDVSIEHWVSLFEVALQSRMVDKAGRDTPTGGVCLLCGVTTTEPAAKWLGGHECKGVL